jgi:hypothetical protein
MKLLLQNQEMFTSNSEVHNINTRKKSKPYKPISNLTLYQKGVYKMASRIFNKLPEYIANLLGNKKTFIATLRQFLVKESFYSLE